MKKLKFGAIALASALTLVGCGGGESQSIESVEVVTKVEEPVTVEFWHSMSGANGEVLNGLINDFNTTIGSDKGITVNAVYQGGYEDLKSKVTASLKAGNSPAIVQATGNHVIEYLESGAVQSLDDYIFNEEIGIEGFEDIYQVYRDENSAYGEEGTFYSLPFNKSTDLLFYNKSLFDEHGLTVPTTWDELEVLSEKVTEITGKPSFSIDNTANYLITYLKQSGAGYTNSNGDILFNNETSLEALKMIKENINKGIWRLAGEDKYSSSPFLAGHVAMYIGSSAGEGFLNSDNFEWASAPIPQVSADHKANIQQGSNVAMLNQNKTAQEVYGAFEFVKYLCSTEANLKWSLNTGYLPIRESVAASEEYQKYVEETNSTTKLYGTQATKYGFVEASFMTDSYSSNMVRTEVGAMVEDVVLGGMDPQAALDLYEGKLK